MDKLSSEPSGVPNEQPMLGKTNPKNLVTAITNLTAAVSTLSDRLFEGLSLREENEVLRHKLEQRQRNKPVYSREDEAIINGTFYGDKV